MYNGKDKSFEFVYYGILELGSPGLRSFGYIIENDKKINEFHETINMSVQNFNIEVIGNEYFKLIFSDITEKIDLTNIKEKYNSTDLKDRENFDDMLTSGIYLKQHRMYIDKATKKIYVDYEVSNRSFGLYLLTFTIEYIILDGKLDMKLYNTTIIDGETIEFNEFTNELF